MVLDVIAFLRAVQAEFRTDKLDVGVFPGEEKPARADLKFFRVSSEDLHGIMLRIDGDGIKKDVFSDPVPQDPLDLAKPRRLQRTGIGAVGVNEVERHHLAFYNIREKPHLLSFMSDERDVGEIVRAPDRASGFRGNGDACRENRNNTNN